MNRNCTLLLSSACAAVLLHGQAIAAAAGQVQENVTITASPLKGGDAVANTVGQVGRDQILQSGGANIGDVLANLPGITATDFAGGASRPVIRGFDASRVRLLENGVGAFDVSDIGPDHGVPIDPLSATRIEVVRGAATVRYGSQAIGGVVNAINNRVPLVIPEQAISGDISGSYETGNSGGELSALLDARSGPVAIHADGFLRSTGDYDIPGGTQANSYFKGDGESAGASYFFGDSRVGAAIVHYDANYGIPSDTTHIKMEQTKEMFGSSFTLNAGALKTLTVDAGYGDYSHDEIEPDGTVDDTFIDKEWDSRAESLFGSFAVFSQAALGVQVQHRDFSALGDAVNYLFPTQTASEAAFAFSEAPLSNTLKLQLGGRVEEIGVKGTPASLVPTSLNFTPVSGSASLVYDPTDMLTFGLTLSSAARAPAVTELFAHGPHDGPGTFETGDPALGLERANSLEATARLHMPDVQVEGSLWGVSFTDFIYGALTGNTCDDSGACSFPGPGDFKELFYRQGGARFWGLEGKVATALFNTQSGTLVGDVLGDYVRATLSSGGNVPRIPPYHIGAGLSWTSDGFDADVHLLYSGAQNETGVTETPTDGFLSLNAGVTWRPGGDAQGWEMSLSGKNLTNSTQRNAVSLNHDAVVLPGRSLRLVLRYAS